MTIRDVESVAPSVAKRLRFGRYVLDLHRGCLLLEGNEIVLRPKTLSVLHYLIENSGRLVSKDELFAAAWPNLVVTDDALVQSIGELRRALGDDGPRLIKTIPRRGYRFEADVSVVDIVEQSSADAAPAPAPTPLSLTTMAPTSLRIGLLEEKRNIRRCFSSSGPHHDSDRARFRTGIHIRLSRLGLWAEWNSPTAAVPVCCCRGVHLRIGEVNPA